jgi:hypothetical protein
VSLLSAMALGQPSVSTGGLVTVMVAGVAVGLTFAVPGLRRIALSDQRVAAGADRDTATAVTTAIRHTSHAVLIGTLAVAVGVVRGWLPVPTPTVSSVAAAWITPPTDRPGHGPLAQLLAGAVALVSDQADPYRITTAIGAVLAVVAIALATTIIAGRPIAGSTLAVGIALSPWFATLARAQATDEFVAMSLAAATAIALTSRARTRSTIATTTALATALAAYVASDSIGLVTLLIAAAVLELDRGESARSRDAWWFLGIALALAVRSLDVGLDPLRLLLGALVLVATINLALSIQFHQQRRRRRTVSTPNIINRITLTVIGLGGAAVFAHVTDRPPFEQRAVGVLCLSAAGVAAITVFGQAARPAVTSVGAALGRSVRKPVLSRARFGWAGASLLLAIAGMITLPWGASAGVPPKGFALLPTSITEDGTGTVFFSDGVLDVRPPSSQSELEKVIDEGDGRRLNALLDWYGASWVVAKSGTARWAESSRDLNGFGAPVEVDRAAGWVAYERSRPVPTLLATSAPVALVVGTQSDQVRFLRQLSLFDVGPRELVVLAGPSSLDEVSSTDLAGVDVLAAVSGEDRGAAAGPGVLDWLNDGGRIFIEAMEHAGPGDGRPLPAPYPVRSQRDGTAQQQWDFTQVALPDEVDVAEFGPPNWNNTGSWAVRRAEQLTPGATVLLADQDGALLVEQQVERGTVVWSGMGLAFHADATGSRTERTLLLSTLGVGPATTAPAGPSDATGTVAVDASTSAIVIGRPYRDRWSAPGFVARPTAASTTALVAVGGVSSAEIQPALSSVVRDGIDSWLFVAALILLCVSAFVTSWRRSTRRSVRPAHVDPLPPPATYGAHT